MSVLPITFVLLSCFFTLLGDDASVEKNIGNTLLTLKIGDITDQSVDVIVNAANAQLAEGAGVCGAIRKAAGKEPFAECRTILEAEGRTSIEVGDARATGSGNLSKKGIKQIIHAVGPQGSGESELRSAYRTSLLLAVQNGHKTIAFPSISTGIYGYPIQEAAETALNEVELFLLEYPDSLDEVRFVFLDPSKDPQKTATYYFNSLL